ncbi:hypothetical protein ACTXPE_04635 [Psychrobacter celer]|uniref:hypothetical protein n=1 Tax=Psychrobacter celer TaxID=306572 RepID=UPI003FD0468B
MKTSKMRKVYPFYEQRGSLVYIGGVQRKLKPDEENKLFDVLLRRKFARIGKAFSEALKGIDFSQIKGVPMSHTPLNMTSIEALKTQAALIAYQLTIRVTPLNERLAKIDMTVWWDGDTYLINTQGADQVVGTSFYLDDYILGHLMAMTDSKLKAFLTGF